MNDNPRAVVRDLSRQSDDEPQFMFFCPGCRCGHWFKITGASPRWTWNGNYEKPTIEPSILTAGCHSFVRDGQIQFLSDCTHALAGKTVSLDPF